MRGNDTLELGLSLLDDGHWDEAVAALESAHAEAPGSVSAYWLAQARFQRARHVTPGSAWEGLAEWQEVARQLAAARGRGLAPTTILSDLRMPRQTGLEVLRRLRGQGLDTPFILMTGFGEDELAREAERLHAVVLQKPFWIDELLGALRRLGARPR